MDWKAKATRLLGSRTIHLQGDGQFALSRLVDIVHSLCGQRERMQSRLGRASCPAEPSVWVVLLTILWS